MFNYLSIAEVKTNLSPAQRSQISTSAHIRFSAVDGAPSLAGDIQTSSSLSFSRVLLIANSISSEQHPAVSAR